MSTEPDPTDPATECKLILPFTTICKVFAAILFALAAYKLWTLFLLLFLALLVAVTLYPVVGWLESKWFPRRGSLAIVISGVMLILLISLVLVVPALLEQIGSFTQHLPTLRQEILGRFPTGGFMQETLDKLFTSPGWSEMMPLLSLGSLALGGLGSFFVVLILTFYLIIDGQRTFEWVLAFYPPLARSKLRSTGAEMSSVMFGYVSGQVITSVLVMIYSFIVLSMLKVPAALMLAILAGMFDVLPILGFLFYTVPACVLALSVSNRAALLVGVCYTIYHVVESYYICPKVYGKRLRLSTLTVLLGLMAGGILAGVPGALVALPLVASYSVIERIWLKPFLFRGVAEKHELQKDEVFGEKV